MFNSTDKEKVSSYMKKWRSLNKDKIRGYALTYDNKEYLERTKEHRREVKHRWYITTRRGGDPTPLKRGRPFKEDFEKPTIEEEQKKDEQKILQSEIIILKNVILEVEPKPSKSQPKPPKEPRKPKMSVIEKKRRKIDLELEKINAKAAAFRELLKNKMAGNCIDAYESGESEIDPSNQQDV